MPSLLPPNATELEHAIDCMAAKQLNIDLAKADTNALTCNAVLLPWLAAAMRVDIDGLSIAEQRQLISSAFAIHKYKGTVYAVQKALNSIFDDAQVIEFKEPFIFDADVKVKANQDATYPPDKFERARYLINQAKNLRSRFGQFKIRFPDATAPLNLGGNAQISPQISSALNLSTTSPINLTGYLIWTL